jgi:hypothetical protein
VPAALTGVHLSELWFAPTTVNRDGNGAATSPDQWIEVYNGTSQTLDLNGWRLDTGGSGVNSYRIPAGTTIRPETFFTAYRQHTGLALNEEVGGQVRLLDAQGQLVDTVTYPPLAPGARYSRGPDGTWHADWLSSPG